MLLPFDCLAYRIADGRLLPSWLGAADEPFVATVLDAVTGLAGLQTSDADVAAPRLLGRASREAKMPLRIAESIWAVERRRWETRIDALVDPEALRDVVFELAARLPRAQVIAEAARHFSLPSEVVVGTLFADRQSRRILVAPDVKASASEVIARYNLALLQALLARSMEVEATITGDASAIVLAAKRDGLLARVEIDDDRTLLTLTGPLAVFHDTAKYGRMLARFVPSVVASPSWSLRARITLGERSAALELEHSAAIDFAATLPAAPDGRLARRVARALRSAGVRVDLCPPAVRAGGLLVLPDFALEWPCVSEGARSTERVLVDVVPFATPEYLASKFEAIAALDVPMLVCVDERFISAASPALVPYRGEIDAFALYAAALRAVEDERVRPSYDDSSAQPSSPIPSSSRPSSPTTSSPRTSSPRLS